MTPLTKSCPYDCGWAEQIEDTKEGFKLLICPQCGKPWVLETTVVPFHQARRVEGFGIQHNGVGPTIVYHHLPQHDEVDNCVAKITEALEKAGMATNDYHGLRSISAEFKTKASHPTPEEIEEAMSKLEPIPVEILLSLADIPEEDQLPPADDKLKCSKCGFVFEDHGIAPEGVCPVCFLDEDSVKGLPEKGNNASAEITEEGQGTRAVRTPLPTHTGVSYLCDGDHVEIKYKSNRAVRTSWADLYGLLEEEERSKAIMTLLGPDGNEPKRTGVSHFLSALEQGLIPEAPAPEAPALEKDDDADYKPILSSVINTRCNYDGGKIGEM